MMEIDELENKLRGLILKHLTDGELVSYCEQTLDKISRTIAEAHVKQCFVCDRRLTQLQEESAALENRVITADDIALVEQVLEQAKEVGGPLPSNPIPDLTGIWLRDQLADYLQQFMMGWRSRFLQPAMRGEDDWLWQSRDGIFRARTFLEKNSDLTIYISSVEPSFENMRFRIRLGSFHQEVTMQRLSESEVGASVTVPRRQRPRNLVDLFIEGIENQDE